MTNATAMTLSLLVFVALFLAAAFIILGGGRLFARRDKPRPRMTRDAEREHPRSAA